MEPTNRPGPALTWSLRALPIATFVTTGLATRSTAAALIALALGWAAAVVFAAAWSARATRAAAQTPAVEGTAATNTAVVPASERDDAPASTVVPTRAGGAHSSPDPQDADVPASAPETPADPPSTQHPDTAAVLTHAEAAVRERDGFLAGWYALVGSTLVPLLYPPGSTGDVRALGAVLDPDSPGHGRELITIAREDVTGIYSYEARGRHIDGGLLVLRATRAGRIYAEFHQVQDGEPNDHTMIPRGFTWEKNDNYDRGWLDPADLTGVWDRRTEES